MLNKNEMLMLGNYDLSMKYLFNIPEEKKMIYRNNDVHWLAVIWPV